MEKSHSGFKYILVVVDVFTRFVFLFPLKNKTMPLITKTLVDLFCLVGFPKIIQSDNGKEFVNRMLKLLVHECAIDHRLITPYHPRANGLAERFVRTVTATILKCLKGKLPLWDKYCSAVQYYMNTKVSEIHGSTPFSLMFGRRSNAFLDYSKGDSTDPTPLSFQQRVDFLASIVYPAIARKIRETQKKAAEKYNSSHLLLSFQPGSVVMALNDWRSSNLEQKYVGPFLVVRRTAGGSYVLKAQDGTFHTRPPSAMKQVLNDHINVAAAEHHEVQSVLAHMKKDGYFRYRVRWKNLPPKFDEWVKEDDFADTTPIKKYWSQKKYRSTRSNDSITSI
jgi:transposase InsO family protein